MKLAYKISKKSGFATADCHICKISGLLHNYGRFSQWKEYHIYSDVNSIYHGDLGAKLLFDNNDKVLLYLAFVFSLNYIYSYKYLKQNKLIKKFIIIWNIKNFLKNILIL